MKVSKAEVQANRAALIRVAAKLFREHGVNGVSMPEIAQAAGLTHGALYSHFKSKKELVAAACGWSQSENAKRWTKVAKQEGRSAYATLVNGYLSAAHLDMTGNVCTVAALGPDLARSDHAARDAVSDGVRQQIDVVESLLSGPLTARRRKALASYAALVGAITIARAVGDPRLRKEMMEAVRATLLGDRK